MEDIMLQVQIKFQSLIIFFIPSMLNILPAIMWSYGISRFVVIFHKGRASWLQTAYLCKLYGKIQLVLSYHIPKLHKE